MIVYGRECGKNILLWYKCGRSTHRSSGCLRNDPLYEPYLIELGAAKKSDDIYGAICFCPITDLEHSDAAYEWLYNRVINDTDPSGKSLYEFTETQKAISAELKALYPAYLNSLKLKSVHDGTPLTDANFENYIKSFIIASAQKALDKGADMSGKPWLTIKGSKVIDIDFNAYLSYVGRMKMIKDPPAFDWLGDQSTTPHGATVPGRICSSVRLPRLRLSLPITLQSG
jgi:hypothetical protein